MHIKPIMMPMFMLVMMPSMPLTMPIILLIMIRLLYLPKLRFYIAHMQAILKYIQLCNSMKIFLVNCINPMYCLHCNRPLTLLILNVENILCFKSFLIARLEQKNVILRCVLNVDKLRVRKALIHLNKLQYYITNNVLNVIVWLQRTHMNTHITSNTNII